MAGSQHEGKMRALDALYKNQGIRRSRLQSVVKPMLATWQVPDGEHPLVLRARLIWHVERVLRTFADDELLRIGRAAYNIDRSLVTHRLDLLKRLAHVDGYHLSPRSAYRTFCETIRNAVTAGLCRPLAVSPADLQDVVAQEKWFARQVENSMVIIPQEPTQLEQFRSPTHDEFGYAVRALYTPPAVRSVRMFLDCPVITPQAVGGGLIVTETRRAGYWVCAFTDSDLLRRQATAAKMPWSGSWLELNGATLIQRVRSLDTPVGVIVNPPDSVGRDASNTLPLPAAEVRAIAARL